MTTLTLILIVVVLLVILLIYQKQTPEHMTLINRLESQNQNFNAALEEKMRIEEESSSERFGDPYEDVQKALNRRLEFMSSTKNNDEEPLSDALHGGSALSTM